METTASVHSAMSTYLDLFSLLSHFFHRACIREAHISEIAGKCAGADNVGNEAVQRECNRHAELP